MGILVTYKFEDLTAEEVVALGQGLDFLPHGRVRKLVDRLQAQITAQDKIAAQNELQSAVSPQSMPEVAQE